MFQSLRQNSLVFIFHKGDNPILEMGTITNVPLAKPKYSQPIPAFLPQEMVVDLTVKVNDRIANYNGLPAQADIADCYSNGESVVVSVSREAMNSEIFAYKLRSIDIINSVDSHKGIIAGCDKILNELNPEYAEKQLYLLEINKLKEQMEGMAKNMQDILLSNKLLVEQLNRKDKE